MKIRAYKRQDRYDIAPWLQEYDRQMSSYIPYLMDLSTPNYVSKIINTDNFGLRKGAALDDTKQLNFILGGSVTFGVGASSDLYTIPSLLTKKSNENWKNLGVRGYNGFQELLIFQSHFLEFKHKVKNIVVLSGINDIYLNFVNPSPHVLGPFFFGSTFEKKLNRKRAVRVFLEKLLSIRHGNSPSFKFIPFLELLKSIVDFNYFEKNYRQKYSQSEFSFYPNLETLIERNMTLWKFIAEGLNANILFMLQPYADWTGKKLTSEEKKLFSILDSFQDGSWHAASKKIKEKKTHEKYNRLFSQACEKNGIKFLDLNGLFDKNADDEWVFIDRIHLTDRGNNIIAKKIMSEMY